MYKEPVAEREYIRTREQKKAVSNSDHSKKKKATQARNQRENSQGQLKRPCEEVPVQEEASRGLAGLRNP